MKKRSHMLVGRYLNELQAFDKPRHEKAFLFGCVEPDYNYLTYLKGALTCGATRSHNFVKAQQNLSKTIVKLAKEAVPADAEVLPSREVDALCRRRVYLPAQRTSSARRTTSTTRKGYIFSLSWILQTRSGFFKAALAGL